MNSHLVKLVTLAMLVIYGLVSSTAGRVFCIPIGHNHVGPECVSEVGEGRGLGHLVETEAACADHGHTHSPFEGESHDESECGCHVHLPVPGDQPSVRDQRTDLPEVRFGFSPTFAYILLACSHEIAHRTWSQIQPPDRGKTDQVRALKSIRLII